MPTQLIQLAQHEPGSAALRVTGIALERLGDIELLEISILQLGHVERCLDPRNLADPWNTAVYRFAPRNPRRDSKAVLLEIDYGVTYHLLANQPYKLVLRRPDGREIEERFTGNGSIRRPSGPPANWTPPPGPAGPASVPALRATEAAVPIPASEPAATHVTPEVTAIPTDLVGEADASEVEQAAEAASHRTRSRRPVWLGALALLAAIAAGLAWWFHADKKVEVAESETLESVRKFIAASPAPGEARAKADALAKSGALLDGQFLLYKYAAEKGDKDAARVIGTFYDPDTWNATKSPLPAPNPGEAARWHKQAAEGGDAESQYRYGMLLRKGRTEEADGPEQAVTWLQKAADQGHTAAKQALNR